MNLGDEDGELEDGVPIRADPQAAFGGPRTTGLGLTQSKSTRLRPRGVARWVAFLGGGADAAGEIVSRANEGRRRVPASTVSERWQVREGKSR